MAPTPPPLALEKELRNLKRGRGIAVDAIATATGPLLRELCDFRPNDDPDTLRTKLKAIIVRASLSLPADERHLALVALGIDPSAQHRFLKDRLRSTLPGLDRDAVRTADRLANRGIRRIAENVVRHTEPAPNPYVSNGWYTETLVSTVRLDGPRPELHERRRIISTRDDLDRLAVSLTVPFTAGTSAAGDPPVQMSTGDRPLEVVEISPGHHQGVIDLPQALREGQAYEYDVTCVLALHSMMRPYYLLTPLRQCQDFRLEVHFDPARLPDRVWRIDGVPRAVAEAAGTPDGVLAPDAGRVAAEFHFLHSGLSYGVRWSTPAA